MTQLLRAWESNLHHVSTTCWSCRKCWQHSWGFKEQHLAFSKPPGRQKSHRRSFIAIFRSCHFGLPEELGDGSQFVLIFTQLFHASIGVYNWILQLQKNPKVHAKVTQRIMCSVLWDIWFQSISEQTCVRFPQRVCYLLSKNSSVLRVC